MKKVKILKYVGPYVPGQVVELEDNVAEQILIVNQIQDGERVIENRRAMLLEDFETMPEQDINTMTAAEAKAAGKKNVVDTTPADEKKAPKKK